MGSSIYFLLFFSNWGGYGDPPHAREINKYINNYRFVEMSSWKIFAIFGTRYHMTKDKLSIIKRDVVL